MEEDEEIVGTPSKGIYKKKITSKKRDDWTDDDQIVYSGSKMIEIFMQATDFSNIFEQNLDEEEQKESTDGVYWERVFANATSDAHKLFKS